MQGKHLRPRATGMLLKSVQGSKYSVSQMLALCCIRVWCSAAALELHPHLIHRATLLRSFAALRMTRVERSE